MIYYSIDIEATGLDPETCKILSLSMIREDTDLVIKGTAPPVEDLPRLNLFFRPEEGTRWEHGAVVINRGLINHIYSKESMITKYDDAVDMMIAFCNGDKKHIVAAGFNFGSCDRQFILRLPNYRSFIGHRVLDPKMFYIDWTKDKPPATEACLAAAGIPYNAKKAHTAEYDAENVIRLIRHHIIRQKD
jgi:oligoribonuclease (3'-5' exoribonuclease)